MKGVISSSLFISTIAVITLSLATMLLTGNFNTYWSIGGWMFVGVFIMNLIDYRRGDMMQIGSTSFENSERNQLLRKLLLGLAFFLALLGTWIVYTVITECP